MPSPTKSTEPKSKLPLLLALVAVLACLLLWDQLSSASPPENSAATPLPAARDRAPDTASGRLAQREPLANLALKDLHDTVDRPLFERGRRPVRPPVVQPVKAPPPPPPRGPDPNALELVGILAGDQQAVVLLKRRQSGQQVRAQQGDTVDGWTIDRIEPQRVILKHGTTEVALQLFKKSNR